MITILMITIVVMMIITQKQIIMILMMMKYFLREDRHGHPLINLAISIIMIILVTV